MVRDLANGRAYRELRPQIICWTYTTESTQFYKSYKMTYFCNSTSNFPKWDAASAPRPDLAGNGVFGFGRHGGICNVE